MNTRARAAKQAGPIPADFQAAAESAIAKLPAPKDSEALDQIELVARQHGKGANVEDFASAANEAVARVLRNGGTLPVNPVDAARVVRSVAKKAALAEHRAERRRKKAEGEYANTMQHLGRNVVNDNPFFNQNLLMDDVRALLRKRDENQALDLLESLVVGQTVEDAIESGKFGSKRTVQRLAETIRETVHEISFFE